MHVQAALAESVQTCTLLVTGRLEEVLDPAQKAAKYPAVQPEQLISTLYKFRYEHHVCYYTYCASMGIRICQRRFGDDTSATR